MACCCTFTGAFPPQGNNGSVLLKPHLGFTSAQVCFTKDTNTREEVQQHASGSRALLFLIKHGMAPLGKSLFASVNILVLLEAGEPATVLLHSSIQNPKDVSSIFAGQELVLFCIELTPVV